MPRLQPGVWSEPRDVMAPKGEKNEDPPKGKYSTAARDEYIESETPLETPLNTP